MARISETMYLNKNQYKIIGNLAITQKDIDYLLFDFNYEGN